MNANFGNQYSGHIVFIRTAPNNPNQLNFAGTQRINVPNKILNKSLFLAQKILDMKIFQIMPKKFIITTNTGSCNFNKEMLIDTSSVIASACESDPQCLKYHIDVDDTENILSKIKELYEGNVVEFDEDQLPVAHKITKLLNLTCFPNFLKPESLKTNENNNRQSRILSAQISLPQFCVYIAKKPLQLFKINTIKNSYDCNIFGILSSSVIRDQISKDSETMEYFYNYDDEFGEFKMIANLFNFCQLQLTSDNMYLIKTIAEELQIDCVLDEIESYISEMEIVSKTINDQEAITDAVDELFDMLYEIESKTVETVKEEIVKSSWSKSKEKIHELAAFILQVIRTDFRLHPYILELLIQIDQDAKEKNDNLKILLPFIVSMLMYSTFGSIQRPNKLFSTSNSPPVNLSNCAFVYRMLKAGIISKEELKYNLRDYAFNIPEVNGWFLTELIEMHSVDKIKNMLFNAKSNANTTNNKALYNAVNQFLSNYFPDKMNLYNEMRDAGEPNDPITKALRDDDVDTIQSILLARNNNGLKSIVPFNIYENYFDGKARFINYAAAYGSIKCFKFLLLTQHAIDHNTLPCAIFGGNNEIIKITQQKIGDTKFDIPNIQKQSPQNAQILVLDDNLIPAIIKHQNDLFDWILDQKAFAKNMLPAYIKFSIESGNTHAFLEIVEKGFNSGLNNQALTQCFYLAAQNGFYLFAQLILRFMNNQLGNSDLNPLISVSFGNLDILKLFLNVMTTKKLELILFFAIKRRYLNVVKFFFDQIIPNNKELNITNNISFGILIQSIGDDFPNNLANDDDVCRVNELFDYLLNQIKILNPSFLNDIEQLKAVLTQICKYTRNVEIASKITDLIIKIDPDYYFTPQFMDAILKGSNDICKFFIKKQVKLHFGELSSSIASISATADEELFLLIIQKLNEETQELFFSSLDRAITSNNKKLVDLLLSKGAFSPNSLKLAVQTKDLDLVNIILKYHSEPSFINKRFRTGTALTISISLNCIDVFKRLISLPGIDANLFGNKNINPLFKAVEIGNMEIFDEIIKLYNGKIPPNWMINEIISYFVCTKSQTSDKTTQADPNRNNDNNNEGDNQNEGQSIFTHVIECLLSLHCVDINYHFEYFTLLTYVCTTNNLYLANLIADYEGVDINLSESAEGDTPLIIAVKKSNQDMAKLLLDHPGIDVNIQNFDQETALSISAKNGLNDIIDLIVNNDKFDAKESRLDYAFYLSKDETALKLLELNSLDVNYGLVLKSPNANFLLIKTPLLDAVESNDIEKVKHILHHPSFNPNKSQFRKALKKTFGNNQKNIFNELFKGIGNSINSFLDFAAMNLSDDIIEEILKNPNFDSRKSDILKAFVNSYTQNHIFDQKVNSLIKVMEDLYTYDQNHDHSINLNQLLPNGKSFYTSIVINNHVKEIVRFFLDHGADPNMPDANGILPLEMAIDNESPAMTFELIKSKKVDFNAKVKVKYIKQNPGDKPIYTTYVHLAARLPYSGILSEMIDDGLIDINMKDDFGDTPLITACKDRRKENVIILFQSDFCNDSNIDFLYKNNEGKDALHVLDPSLPNDLFTEDDKDEYFLKLIELLNQ